MQQPNRQAVLVYGFLLSSAAFAVLMLMISFLRRPHAIEPTSALLIFPGMTEQQVVSILGVPNGDYANRDEEFGRLDTKWSLEDGTIGKSWHADAGFIVVYFDQNGKVTRRARWVSQYNKADR